MILNFTTTVIGQKTLEIEILVNTIPIYSSYGLPIIRIPIHEMGSIRDNRCMKWSINNTYNIKLHNVKYFKILGGAFKLNQNKKKEAKVERNPNLPPKPRG